MKTSTKATIGGVLAIAGAVATLSRPPEKPKNCPPPPVRKESPCYREAKADPACADMLRCFPSGGS